jgi:hypothetical protein
MPQRAARSERAALDVVDLSFGDDGLEIAATGSGCSASLPYGAGDVWELVTDTLTFDVHPTPLEAASAAASPLLVLRWEKSNQDVFGKDSRSTSDVIDDLYDDSWFESVIGVVFTTAP